MTKKKKAPLRKIVRELDSYPGAYGRAVIKTELECGHTAWGYGIYKMRCHRCSPTQEKVDGKNDQHN